MCVINLTLYLKRQLGKLQQILFEEVFLGFIALNWVLIHLSST